MPLLTRFPLVPLLVLVALPFSASVSAQSDAHPLSAADGEQAASPPKGGTKQATPEAELQQAISAAANDRAALLRNLEAFLKKYPDSAQRPQIYRALVEASLQLRDTTRAADYAERIVALAPDDMSMTLLTIELLERHGDEAALRRAVHQSLVASSPSTATARSIRAPNERASSSGSGHMGAPNVTRVGPGFGRFMPLPNTAPVPSSTRTLAGAGKGIWPARPDGAGSADAKTCPTFRL